MSEIKDYIGKIEGAERRFVPMGNGATIEVRSEEGSEDIVIEGYAAKFDKRTDLGWFYEEIAPGAFDDVLKDDVRCLFNHSMNQVLARTKSKTLEIWVDEVGLKYRFKVSKNRQLALDVADMISTGDVSQSSFAFRAKKVEWSKVDENSDKELRRVMEVERLYDVSPVTYPAYEDTDVAQRSFDAYKAKEAKPKEEKKPKRSLANLRLAQAKYMLNKKKISK